jgi:hypothetical protein
VAIGMANLARVSRDAAVGDRAGLRANLAAALRAAALLALPALTASDSTPATKRTSRASG